MDKIKEVQEVKISYQTTDGRIFNDKSSAESHQMFLDLPKVYVINTPAGFPAVFSKKDFAEDFANTYTPALSIHEVAVDFRKNKQ